MTLTLESRDRDRKANLRVAYLADKDVFPGVPFNLFCRLFFDWKIVPIIRNDLCLGVVFNRGSEVHIAILPEYRKRWAGKWLGTLIRSFMVNDKVTTVVTATDQDRLSFALRLGWRVTEQLGQFIKLEMTIKDHNNVWNKTKT